MLNVAVVEDNDQLRDVMVETLRADGHNAFGVDSAEAMVDQAGSESIDIVVVDVNLPGEDGFSLTRRLRSVQPQTGIIMVTGRNRDTDRRTGFEGGADIFLSKPVSTEELRAAVAALSRRLRPSVSSPTLRFDVRRRTLVGNGGEVQLRPQEAALLGALLRAPDGRLENWQVLEIFERAGWSYSRTNIGVAVFRLGAKLREAGSGERPIRAVRNWGYQLIEPVTLD